MSLSAPNPARQAAEHVDAITAAENYRRACLLTARARETLIVAVRRDRRALNLREVSRRAGLYERTLYKWIEREDVNHGRVP